MNAVDVAVSETLSCVGSLCSSVIFMRWIFMSRSSLPKCTSRRLEIMTPTKLTVIKGDVPQDSPP